MKKLLCYLGFLWSLSAFVITPEQVQSFGYEHIEALTPEQIMNFTAEVIAAFSSAQWRFFSIDQLGFLAQRIAVLRLVQYRRAERL